MVTRTRWPGTGRWAALAAAAACVIGLVACGSAASAGKHPAPGGASVSGQPTGPARSGSGRTPASGQSAAAARASAGVPLCSATGRLMMVVMRSGGVPRFRELLPGGVTVRDVRGVRALAAALCELPPMPPRLVCPPSSGGVFRLGFAASRRGFRPVMVQISGCRQVTGVGPVRSWAHSARFGRLLNLTLQGPPALCQRGWGACFVRLPVAPG